MVVSLAHYFTQHGHLCQDPEMEVLVHPPREGHPGRVEALSFQQAQPPMYQRVSPEPGMVLVSSGTWLRNLNAQGHRMTRETDCRSPDAGGLVSRKLLPREEAEARFRQGEQRATRSHPSEPGPVR